MNIAPLHDRLVVRERKPSTVSTGGIYIGETVDDGFVKEIVEGEVLSVGPGLRLSSGRRDTMWNLEPGMIVRYSPVCAVPVSGEKDTLIIRRDAVVGIAT